MYMGVFFKNSFRKNHNHTITVFYKTNLCLHENTKTLYCQELAKLTDGDITLTPKTCWRIRSTDTVSFLSKHHH